MNEKFIITIGRQYGSGGRMIGQKLAKDLNIPCYDKELLTIAAKESGFSEEILETLELTVQIILAVIYHSITSFF